MTTSTRRIRAEQAVIQTATVAIKALTISGKQMTLAVFRQLPRERILEDDLSGLRGTPWGRVNYHPDGCKDDPPHLHIVWEWERELRHAWVSQSGAGHNFVDERRQWLMEVVSGWMLAEALTSKDAARQVMGMDQVVVGGRYVSPLSHVRQMIRDAPLWHPDHYAYKTDWGKQGREAAQAEAKRIAARFAKDVLTHADAQEYAAYLIDAERQYDNLFQRLTKLDQLFVAV